MSLHQHKGSALEASLRTFNLADVEEFRSSGQWQDATFLDLFLENVKCNPCKAAIVSYQHGVSAPVTVTYGQLGVIVDRIAIGLLAAGVNRADVVSIQAVNGWQGPAIALATMRVGAVPNPIPITYRERELRFMLTDGSSKVYFVPQEFRGYQHAKVARKLAEEIDTLEHIYVLDGATSVPAEQDFVTHFIDTECEPDPSVVKELESRRPSADDVAMLVYTSGTTGTPKGALHTYNTAWSGYRNVITRALALTASDVTFMASTLGHLTGFIHGMLVPLSMGQKVVYQDLWDVNALLDMMDKEGITWTLSATTFALDMVAAQKRRAKQSGTMRAFACGGASIPPGVAADMDKMFSTSLVPLWGCSETGIASIHTLGASVETLGASDGYPVPWQETRIVDVHEEIVERGTIGNLQVRGPGIFAGYLNRQDLTAAAFTDDGWYDTGDLGLLTPEGAIRIEGRSKDVIIRGGQNISAVEIENALFDHENIQEVAVVSYPDERLGERVCAVVVAKGDEPTLATIVAHLDQAGMAKPFWPQRLVVVDSLPRTPSGKIQKFVLRENLASVGDGKLDRNAAET